MKPAIALALLLTGCGCSHVSSIAGYHWHNAGFPGFERYLVNDHTGALLYWMFENGGGTCTAQSKIHAAQFTEYFLTCDDAERAIEKREKENPIIP